MSERTQIFREIQSVLSGHSEHEVLGALIASLVVHIGVSADNLEHAKQIARQLPDDMIPPLVNDWDKLRKHRRRVDTISKLWLPPA